MRDRKTYLLMDISQAVFKDALGIGIDALSNQDTLHASALEKYIKVSL